MARSRSSSGYFRGAGMLCILPLDQSLHQTRGDSLMSVPELLDEGRGRYNCYFARKTASQPSRADERRQRSIRAIQEFNRGAP